MRKAKSTIWIGTSGVGSRFGGVAQVARSSVRAIQDCNDLDLRLIVSLLEKDSTDSFYDSCPTVSTRFCNKSRLRFFRAMGLQVLDPPDLVIYDHIDLSQVQAVLPDRLSAPYIIWIHGVEVWKSLPSRKLSALSKARLLIFNSEYTRTKFAEHHGVDTPSVVVPLTADLMASKPPGQKPRSNWALTVGRMVPNRPKGHEEILSGLSEVINAVPDFQWHIVGAGNRLEEFRRRVEVSQVRDHVHIHGHLPDDALAQLFRNCKVFCMPSYGEGFGIVYLEAMGAGCVPIGSTLDAATEVIGDGGICVPLDGSKALPEAMIRVLTATERDFHAMSEKAYRRSRRFTQDKFQKHFLEALEIALGQRLYS